MHNWFNEVSGLGLKELRTQVMHPPQAKKAEEVATIIEKWKDCLRRLEEMDDEPLPEKWKIAAVSGILTGPIKDHMDM